MNMKPVIGLSIVAIAAVAAVSCYIFIVFNNRMQVKDLADNINYNEASIRKILINSGINSSKWDEYDPYVSPQKGLAEADKIDQLPGQPNVSFSQYSGYVTVDGQAKRELFYYFAESPNSPTTKPLVLWLSGGTACSSLMEAMTGLGPYRVLNDNTTLELNPHAWNNVANILFLETPISTGFSYSETESDYGLVGDKMTAQDSYTFLINWLERFPEYKNREFYIAGDTSAGHYVPQLSLIILHMNRKVNPTKVIDLRGIMVENAILDEPCWSFGSYDFLYKHNIISESLMQILKVCDFSNKVENLGVANNLKCKTASTKLLEKLGSPDLEALANPTCDLSSPKPHNNWTSDSMKIDPCISEYMTTYMNMDQVQKALHAKQTKWLSCSASVVEWKDVEPTVLLAVKELMSSGIRVWLYSGENEFDRNADSVEYVIKALKLDLKYEKYTWYNAPNEVGGFAVEYHNMTFVTVRGVADHIPSFAPAKALTIFSSFIQGKLLPGAKSK